MRKWVSIAVCFSLLFLLAGCLPPSAAPPHESAIPSPSPQPTAYRQWLDYTAINIICEEPRFSEWPALLLSKEDLDLFHEMYLSWPTFPAETPDRTTNRLVAHQLSKYTDEFFVDHGLIIVSGMAEPGCTVDVDSVWFDGDAIDLSINTIDALAAFEPGQYRPEEYTYHIFIEIPNQNLSPNDILSVKRPTVRGFMDRKLRTASSDAFPIDYNLRTVLNYSSEANNAAVVVSSWESLQGYIDNELSLLAHVSPISGESYYFSRYSSVDPAGLTTAVYTSEFFERHRLVLFSYAVDYKEQVAVDRVEADESAIVIYTKKLPIEDAIENRLIQYVNYFFILEARADDIDGKTIRVHQQ